MTDLHPLQTQQQQQQTSLSRSGAFSKFRFIVMHSSASKEDQERLVGEALRTTTFLFSVDPIVDKADEFLIKIELLNPSESSVSDVLLFFTHKLPCHNDPLFPQIQVMLQQIFLPSKKFHGWNFNKQHLNAFVRTGYLSQVQIDQITIVDLQDRFKQWYNKRFKHQENCPASSIELQADDSSCTCLHRPYKNRTDKWTIDNAFKYVLFKHLTASNNLSSIWRKYYYLFFYQTTFRTFLMIVESDWDLAQLTRYKQYLKR